MSRQLRLLGLALLALAASGAMTATGAQAGIFTAGAYPATITGANVGPHELTTELGVMKCGLTLHGNLPEPRAEATVVPTFGTSCKIGGNVVHVFPNGCDFVLHAGNTIEMHVVGGWMDIKCPAGSNIDFEITSMPVCHMTIPEQLGIGPVTYTVNTAGEDVDADFNIVEGLIYRLDAGCLVEGLFNTGSWVGTTTLTADNGGGGVFFGVE
jgi:hypothetical protein